MILDNALQVVELVKIKQQMFRDKESLGAYQTRKNNIKELNDKVEEAIKLDKMFRKYALGKLEVVTSLQQVSIAIANCLRRFRDDPESMKRTDAITELRNSVEKLSREAHNQAEFVWKEYVKHVELFSDEILNILRNFPGSLEVIEEITRRQRKLADLVRNIPMDETEVETIKSLQRDIQQLWTRLDVDNIPQGVMDFFKRVSSPGGATLADLTPTILEWLIQHGFHSTLTIRFTQKYY